VTTARQKKRGDLECRYGVPSDWLVERSHVERLVHARWFAAWTQQRLNTPLILGKVQCLTLLLDEAVFAPSFVWGWGTHRVIVVVGWLFLVCFQGKLIQRSPVETSRAFVVAYNCADWLLCTELAAQANPKPLTLGPLHSRSTTTESCLVLLLLLLLLCVCASLVPHGDAIATQNGSGSLRR